MLLLVLPCVDHHNSYFVGFLKVEILSNLLFIESSDLVERWWFLKCSDNQPIFSIFLTKHGLYINSSASVFGSCWWRKIRNLIFFFFLLYEFCCNPYDEILLHLDLLSEGVWWQFFFNYIIPVCCLIFVGFVVHTPFGIFFQLFVVFKSHSVFLASPRNTETDGDHAIE